MARHKISTQKSISFLCVNDNPTEKESRETIPSTRAITIIIYNKPNYASERPLQWRIYNIKERNRGKLEEGNDPAPSVLMMRRINVVKRMTRVVLRLNATAVKTPVTLSTEWEGRLKICMEAST